VDIRRLRFVFSDIWGRRILGASGCSCVANQGKPVRCDDLLLANYRILGHWIHRQEYIIYPGRFLLDCHRDKIA